MSPIPSTIVMIVAAVCSENRKIYGGRDQRDADDVVDGRV